MLGCNWTHKTSWADVQGSPAEAVEPCCPLPFAYVSIFIIIIIIVLLYYLFYITALFVFPFGMLKSQHI